MKKVIILCFISLISAATLSNVLNAKGFQTNSIFERYQDIIKQNENAIINSYMINSYENSDHKIQSELKEYGVTFDEDNTYDDFLFYLFKKINAEQMSYSDLSKVYLDDFFNFCFNRVRIGGNKFISEHTSRHGANDFKKDYGNIEYRDEYDNIYSYTKAFEVKKKNYSISFYSDQVPANTNSSSYGVITRWDDHVPMSHAYMNSVCINNHHVSIEDFFNNPEIHGAELITPVSCFYENNNYYISYTHCHSYIEDIVYTEPSYAVIAGQLINVNSGINPRFSDGRIASLCSIDTNSLHSDKTVTFNNIRTPDMVYTDNHIFVYEYNRGEIASKYSPIYVLNFDMELIDEIYPLDGDVFCEIEETPDYLVFSGYSTKSGYVGYKNPLIAIIDKNSHKLVARKVFKEKDVCFKRIYVLSDNELLLITTNNSTDFEYRYGGCRIIQLSSLIPTDNLPEHIRRFAYLQSITIDERIPDKDLAIFRDKKSGKYGLAHEHDLFDIIRTAEFDNIQCEENYIKVEQYLGVGIYDNRVGILDFDGNDLIPCDYISIDYDSPTRLFITRDASQNYGLINFSGVGVCPSKYRMLAPFPPGEHTNIFIVRKDDGTEALINDSGQELTKSCYSDLVYSMSGLIISTNQQGAKGLLRISGEEIVSPIYDRIHNSRNDKNLFIVLSHEKYGIIDCNGSIIIEPKYIELSEYKHSSLLLILEENGKYGLVNYNGETVLPAEYELISVIRESPEYFVVKTLKGLYGLVDNKGQFILKPKYTNIEKNNDESLLVTKGRKVVVSDYFGNFTRVP